MRVPLRWLHEFCHPGLDTPELADRLDMTGTKVERVLRHGVGDPDGFVVGRVLEANPHPDADRLTVCRVAVGDGEVARIVCGAPNVAQGQTVAVARPGAVMPDGTRLQVARLRGVESQGMILAEDELGIGVEHAGILVLDGGELEPGTPLADVLAIVDEVLELEVTPNRPDCLGVYGVARELHAATGAPLAAAPWAQDPGSEGSVEGAEVVVEVPDLCPRFTVRRFEDVRVGPSPPWLKARLMAAGQRPISNVVDVTNYVMLLTGQPLHAFDLGQVRGGRLLVRRADEGEPVATLDGEERRLDGDVVVICDDDGPTSIAGVMGGARSEVSDATTSVLMEAATWNGPNIQRTSTRLGLRSEASARFEKQLQPEQALEAQAVASALMAQVCGARALPGTIDIGGPGPSPARIRLRSERMTRLLGAEIPSERAGRILEALGFDVTPAADGLDATVPHHRRDDVTREADVIEEVARIDGVDTLPTTLPARPDAGGRLTGAQRGRRRVEDALVGAGVLEVVGWSFQSPDVADRLRLAPDDRRRHTVTVENPMSSEASRLRALVLGSLLDAAALNVARGTRDLRLFETGAVYVDEGGELPDERRHVGVLMTGAAREPSWRSAPAAPADFFAAKGVLAALLEALRVPWSTQPAPEPFLHPGRAAAVHAHGEPLGWLGELHPLVCRAWDLEQAAAFELDLDRLAALAAAESAVYRDFAPFPAVHQDLAVVVGEDVAAGRVVEVVHAAAGDELARARVFDVYRGPQAGEGRVSLALSLEFRAGDRTLTDEEVAVHRERIATALAEQVGEPSVPSVTVFGAAGYAGAIAARLIDRHPWFELAAVTARSDAGRRLDDLYPRHRVPLVLEEPDVERHGNVDAALVAYPHGAAAPLVAELRRRGVRVVDLSADFRLRDREAYESWYGDHGAPELFDAAAYGLPELHRDEVTGADLVAVPGCYPTATLLALAPLARAGAIADVVVDAKSGVSGAGREATQVTHFVSADENVNPYGVDGHRHSAEINQELAALGADVTATFVPHLVPLDQGELVSCYVTPRREIDAAELSEMYEDAYAGEPFVEMAARPPGVRDVRETNIARISVHVDPRSGRVLVFAAIDNLWKGAASQAVQNLNLMFGRDEGEGIS